jgi:hypothetical protein
MNNEKVLILKNAKRLPEVTSVTVYDEEQHLSIIKATGQPVVMTELGTTHSKTNAYPGDDDPDPGAERCY